MSVCMSVCIGKEIYILQINVYIHMYVHIYIHMQYVCT